MEMDFQWNNKSELALYSLHSENSDNRAIVGEEIIPEIGLSSLE